MKITLSGTRLYTAGKGMQAGGTHRNLAHGQTRALPGWNTIIGARNDLSSAVCVVFPGMNIRQEGAGV